jgi:hypothetical protein
MHVPHLVSCFYQVTLSPDASRPGISLRGEMSDDYRSIMWSAWNTCATFGWLFFCQVTLSPDVYRPGISLRGEMSDGYRSIMWSAWKTWATSGCFF